MDLDAFSRAVENRDTDAMLALYADDAVMEVIDKNNPPSRPLTLQGKSAIEGLLRDVNGREMTHRVEQPVVGEGRVAYNEACQYPDGVRVLTANTLVLHDGKIAAHTMVQAWDE